MADQLSIRPENVALHADGYHFYSGQIFDLVVTLTLAQGTINSGSYYVVIDPLGVDEQLQPYGAIEEGTFDQDQLTVTLKLEPSLDDPRVGIAHLQVLALGRVDKIRHSIEAHLSSDSQVADTMWFHQILPYVSIPVVVDDFYLPMASEDAWTPSTVQGRFVHYRFAVADEQTQAPLARMLVRLTTVPANATLLDVALYDSHDATRPLQVRKLGDTWYADLQTDTNGMAEAYLCAQPFAWQTDGNGTTDARAAAGQLTAKIGAISGSAGSFLVADLNASDAALQAPYIVGEPVYVDAHTKSLPVIMPRYDKATVGDTLFLFCNRVCRAPRTVPDLAWFNGPELSIAPYDLHSGDFDDAKPNELQYCVLRTTGEVRVSSVHHFSVAGIPPTPVPEEPQGYGPPPQLDEVPEHGVVNCHTLADGGLHVRVVLGPDGLHEISPDTDTLKLRLYLNGFRADSDAPKGAIVEGPDEFVIMQADINRGYVALWFRAQLFLGYGRKKSNAQAGTFLAQYVVATPSNRSVKVRSPPLSLGLDTIAPGETGVDDATQRSTSSGVAQRRQTV